MDFNTNFPEGRRITMPIIYMCACCPAHNYYSHAFDLVVSTLSLKMGAPFFTCASSAQIYDKFYNKWYCGAFQNYSIGILL